MTDEHEQESKFLIKNYRAFLADYYADLKSGDGEIHPPQAFRVVYERMMRPYIMSDKKVTYADLIALMDMVARFMTYLDSHEISYNHFQNDCSCDQSGGDNK